MFELAGIFEPGGLAAFVAGMAQQPPDTWLPLSSSPSRIRIGQYVVTLERIFCVFSRNTRPARAALDHWPRTEFSGSADPSAYRRFRVGYWAFKASFRQLLADYSGTRLNLIRESRFPRLNVQLHLELQGHQSHMTWSFSSGRADGQRTLYPGVETTGRLSRQTRLRQSTPTRAQ